MNTFLKAKRGSVGSTFLATEFRNYSELLLGSANRAKGKRLARVTGFEWVEFNFGVVSGLIKFESEFYEPQLSLGPWKPNELAMLKSLIASHKSVLLEIAKGHSEKNEALLSKHFIPLLPGELANLSFACNCQAWQSVCEHVYALLYVVIEILDEEPLKYLTWLGFELDELLTPQPPANPQVLAEVEVKQFNPANLDFAKFQAQTAEILAPAVIELLASFYQKTDLEPSAQTPFKQ